MALDIKVALSWVNYCRLCLQDEGLKIPIFEREGVTENIPKKIKECLNILTYEGDPLPRMICFQCLSKLNTAYELHTKAMESFKLVLITLKPLKQFSTVKEYMKDCQFSLEDDELIKDTSVDRNIPKSVPGKQLGIVGSTDEGIQQNQEDHQEQVRGRVTRSRVSLKSPSADSGKPPSADNGRSPAADSSRITLVPNVENPSLVSRASTSKEPVFLVPLPPKPRPHDNHFHESMDHDSNEDHCKRKRKRITDHYDEALMDSGGNLVLAAGGRRGESRYRDGKRKKVGPASRTRAQATCLPFPSSWQCALCSCFFASHSMLRRHLSICRICQTCGLEFLSAKDKAVHEEDHMFINLSKSVELLYKCDNCDRAFAAHLMLKVHVKYDHPESAKHLYADPYQPGIYADPVSPEGDAQAGIASNCKCDSDEDTKPPPPPPPPPPPKVEERFVEGHEICPKCSRPFVTKQRLNYHLLDHDQLIKCLFCPWKFPVGPGRRRHQRRMHGDKAEPVCFTCSVCRESFETKSILFLHKKNSHGRIDMDECSKAEGSGRKGELEHCHVCDKMIQPSKFMAHLLHHADDAYGSKPQSDGLLPNPAAPKPDSKTESLHCPICNVTSATQELHRAHIAQKHIQHKSNSFRCDGCSQAFANVEAINRHSCPGKEKERQWKNCKHCGQNLSDDIVHVCDNECPICHKIFKSARGQRLHIQHKHDSSGAEDQANSESRLSVGDSGFEQVVVKEEKEDAEEAVNETAEPEPAEPEATEPETAEPEATEPEAAESEPDEPETVEPVTAEAVDIPSDAETEPRTPPDTPPPPSNPLEISAPSSPNPVADSSPIVQDITSSTSGTEKPSQAKGMPKIRLRPPGALISEVPTSLNAVPAAPRAPTTFVRPPVSFRPFVTPVPASDVPPLTPFQEAEKPNKSIIIRRYSGPSQSYSLHVANVNQNSISNTLKPAAKNNVPEPRVDHSLTSNAPPSSGPANIPPLTMNTASSLAVTSGGTAVGGDVATLPSYSMAAAPPAYDPLQNSSQIPPSSFLSNPGVSLPEVISVDTPSVIMTAKPSAPHQPRMIRAVPPLSTPFSQNNSIRCVRISSLQPAPVSSGMISQSPSHQPNFDSGYGRLYEPMQLAPHPAEFNPVQPPSGATGREENLLRDVLLGRRTDQDFF